MDSLTVIGLIIVYGAGILIAYRKGTQDTKSRYSKLINRLHKQYNIELNTENGLLIELFDLEKDQ